MNYFKLIISVVLIFIFNGCSKQQSKQNENSTEKPSQTKAAPEVKKEISFPSGSYSYFDRAAQVNYQLIISPDGNYSMTDFGGDGTIYGKTKVNGYSITFYDDNGMAWTTGSFSGGIVNVGTKMGNLSFRR